MQFAETRAESWKSERPPRDSSTTPKRDAESQPARRDSAPDEDHRQQEAREANIAGARYSPLPPVNSGNYQSPEYQQPSPNIPQQKMSHRVEPYPMPPPHRRPSYHERPSPPPIATLSTHSPSPSVSSHDTPPMHSRNSLPHVGGGMYYDSRPPVPMHTHHNYSYAPPPPAQYSNGDGYNMSGMPPMMSHSMPPPPRGGPGADFGLPYPGGGSVHGMTIIHTDDAATKLSDRVRRRCFNCCTTDTSTWRRSNLSPGKVLCNKCGLFERTHSRPRPEQFPHKRGPLASSALGARAAQRPSPQQNGHQAQHPAPNGDNQLPPIQNGPPYSSYAHPSIPPLNERNRSGPQTLPEINSWASSENGPEAPTARRSSVGQQQQPERKSPLSKHSSVDDRESVTLPKIEVKDTPA